MDGAIRPGDDAHAAVAAHLEFCGDCRARLEDARTVKQRADALLAVMRPQSALPQDFEEVLRLAPAAGPAEGSVVPAGRRTRPFVALAWAASLAVAVGAGWIARSTIGAPDAGQPVALLEARDAAPPAGTDAGPGVAQPEAGSGTPAPAPLADVASPGGPGGPVGPAMEPQAGPAQLAGGTTPRRDADVPFVAGAEAARPPARLETVAEAPAERAALGAPVLDALAVTGTSRPVVREGAERLTTAPVVPPPHVAAAAREPVSPTAPPGTALGAPANRPVVAEFQRGGVVEAAALSAAARDTLASPPSPRPAAPERLAAPPTGDGVLSRLFGRGDRDATPRARWRGASVRDVERQLRHELAHVHGFAIDAVWTTEEAGVITYRIEQRIDRDIVLQLLQWHDPVTSKLRAAVEGAGYAVVVRTTERADGSNVVFADLSDGTHVTLTAALPLAELIRLVGQLRPFEERR
jgi:hypothetical protein